MGLNSFKQSILLLICGFHLICTNMKSLYETDFGMSYPIFWQLRTKLYELAISVPDRIKWI